MASTSSWSARRMLRILAMLGTALVGGLGIFVINASPAQAQGTYIHRYCLETYQHPTPRGHEWVDYCYGFDYSGAGTNRLRGYARIVSHSDGDVINIHLDATLRLGDRNGVLAQLEEYNNGGFLSFDTDYVSCHRTLSAYYISHLYLTLRWSDGTLESFDPGQFGLHAEMADPVLGACTNNSLDWYSKP